MTGLKTALLALFVFLVACNDGGGVQTAAADTGPTAPGPTAPGPTAPSNALVVRMLYGSEKQPWIEAVTAAFNARGTKSTSGRPIRVEAVPMGSNDSLERILSGADRPTVWSPASRLLVPVANRRWARGHEGQKLVLETPPLVLSPVVIAMWKPMAEALGWPRKKLGWADLAALAGSTKGWSAYGHPEWGPFQFGHTHPDYSNSGIVSILATAYAATGKTSGLTVADVRKPEVARFLARVEAGVIHYGESTGFFGRQMFERGPAYLSAAVLYESLVLESYDKAKYPNRPLPVVSIYPREGTFWSDHPFVILNAPWVNAELRTAAKAYRDFLLARPQQRRALEFGFRPSDPGIAASERINASRGSNAAEPRTLLEAPGAEVIEAVRAVWGQSKKRVEVEVVLDTSGSMSQEGRLQEAKEALKLFVSRLSNQDRLGVTVFGSQAQLLSPLGPLGPKRAEVIERIDGLFPNGGTRLIDTVSEVYARMQRLPPGKSIRALVVLSDGADTDSTATTAETLQTRLSADQEGRSIKVFTIAYGTGSDVNVGLMKGLASASGAKSYTSDPARIDQVYRDIATFF